MQRRIDTAFGAEIRVGTPGDVGQQAGGEPQTAIGGRLCIAAEQPVHPGEQHVAMFGKASLPHTFAARGRDERIEPRLGAAQLRIKQPFTQAKARGDDR